MFAIPRAGQTWIGTTDTDYDGDPGDARATRDDVEYLLASVRHVFPRLTIDDVLFTTAGVRALVRAARIGIVGFADAQNRRGRARARRRLGVGREDHRVSRNRRGGDRCGLPPPWLLLPLHDCANAATRSVTAT
jgi:glycerol-3-phosphate dehydrogenase